MSTTEKVHFIYSHANAQPVQLVLTFKLNDAYAMSAAAVTKICVFCCAPSHLTEVYKADSNISASLERTHTSDRSGQSCSDQDKRTMQTVLP